MRSFINVLTVLVLTPTMMLFKTLFVISLLYGEAREAKKRGENAPVLAILIFAFLTPVLVFNIGFRLLFDGGISQMNTKEIFHNFIAIGD